ncbi:MAG: patatin family protein [Alphaproteobacteria bacterium]|nr:patatin family protein [Alphaproteobacteria bacterium]
MKTGLVLEGGAKRGIYTAGVLDVLLENNILTDGVIGVSAGAIHGCSYVALQKGRSIRYNMKYGNDYRFMSFKSWLKTGSVVDTQFCYHELPEKLDPFDNETFQKSGIQFYVTCSNLDSGKAEYIFCRDMFAEIDYLRASASLPLVSKIVEIDSKKLLDGGITDSIPLKAFESMGYEKNIVILTRPKGYRKKPNPLAWLSALVYRKYPRFVEAIYKRHNMYNDELDYVAQREKAGQALVLRPSRFIKVAKMEQDLNRVKEMYELGRHDAMTQLDKIKKFLAD